MSHVTYEKLLNIAREYSGLDCFSEANKRFVHRVLERMFYRGKHGSLVGICMCANNGCLTLPEDVEHVEKVKVNGCVQSLFSHWYEFSQAREADFQSNYCGVSHLPNKYYTQYSAPCDVFYPVVKSRSNKESKDAFITIHGRDVNGEKVFLRHSGSSESGEMLPIMNGKVVQGTIPFATITGIEKSKTKDYVDLFAKDTCTGELSYLSGYSPRETKPCYSRIKVQGCPDDQPVRLDILARLKILPEYECNELVPVIGLDVLETICQEIRLMKDNDFQSSVAAGAVAKELIRDENNYKYGNNVDVMDIIDMGCGDSGDVW